MRERLDLVTDNGIELTAVDAHQLLRQPLRRQQTELADDTTAKLKAAHLYIVRLGKGLYSPVSEICTWMSDSFDAIGEVGKTPVCIKNLTSTVASCANSCRASLTHSRIRAGD